MRWQYETDACFRSKAAPCGRGQFESPASPKNDASGPEQVSGAIIAAPQEQVLLTRSVGLHGAQSPAPHGAFYSGLLTAPSGRSAKTGLEVQLS
jgi:hypothetical protein